MNLKYHHLIFILCIHLTTCNNRSAEVSTNNKDTISLNYQDTVSFLILDTNNSSKISDTLLVSFKKLTFPERVNKIKPLFIEWKYEPEHDKIIRDSVELQNHWLLNIYFKRIFFNKEVIYPQDKDWKHLQKIHQYSFKRGWKYFIEEWEFLNKQAARQWLKILLTSHRLDDAKPPRFFWTEDNKIYMIMATAADDWFAYSQQLAEYFAEKNIPLIHLYNETLDLVEYKKRKEGATNGIIQKKQYYYQPDSVGIYNRYLLFKQLLSKHREAELFNSIEIKTFIYGNTVGDYETVDEDLIGIKSKISDPHLQNMDFVGKNESYIEEYYGLELIKGSDFIIDEFDSDILILHFRTDSSGTRTVDWFNFLRTNLNIESSDYLPEELLYFNEKKPVD